MDRIEPRQVIQERLASSLGLASYKRIIDSFQKVDISSDEEFQRIFNGFYRIRRNEQWRKAYYDLFESVKDDAEITFDEIFDMLLERTGNMEASFASKMLATINPQMPIWDQYVIANLGIRAPAQSASDRSSKIKQAYSEIVEWYDYFLKTDNANECIEEFDRLLPKYSTISDVKKIDYFLFSLR